MEGAAGQGRKRESFGAAFCWRFSQEKVIGRRVLILAKTDHHWTGAPAVTAFTPCTHEAGLKDSLEKTLYFYQKRSEGCW
jgi:hypothetical protein